MIKKTFEEIRLCVLRIFLISYQAFSIKKFFNRKLIKINTK